jgi:hypothetical protein
VVCSNNWSACSWEIPCVEFWSQCFWWRSALVVVRRLRRRIYSCGRAMPRTRPATFWRSSTPVRRRQAMAASWHRLRLVLLDRIPITRSMRCRLTGTCSRTAFTRDARGCSISQPRQPRLLTAFGDVAGFSHPHTFIRLANGNVLATFQYRSDPPAMSHQPDPGTRPVIHSTGGLVEMDERGQIVRSTSASDPAIQNASIYPYSVLPVPAFDRAISTTTDMDEANTKATSQWLQVWRLSDLTLLRSVALTPGPRGDEHQFTGEPRLLGDGQSVYIHTFNCGLYLLRGIDRREPTVTFVRSFQGKNCGIPILTGHYWLQTVPEAHAVVVLDIANPEQPRDVQTFPVGDDEQPHWLAIDATGRRIVLNSSGGGTGNRLFVLNFDPATGQLSFDDRFRDAGSMRPGIVLTGKTWPHGFSGTAVPHGTVFSR